MTDFSLSLEQHERDVWKEPRVDSYLVRRCHALRKVPLDRLEIEDLRMLAGQNIGTATLLPLIFERLSENPLAEGDFFPGDLLLAVLREETCRLILSLGYQQKLADICRDALRIASSGEEELDQQSRRIIESFLEGL